MYRKIFPARTVNQMLRNLANSFRGIGIDAESPLYAVAEVLPDSSMESEIMLLASNKESNYIRHVILVEGGKVKADKNDFLFSEFKDDVYTYKHVCGAFGKYYIRERMTKSAFIEKTGVAHIGNAYDEESKLV